MASFIPMRGTREELKNVPLTDGQFLYETDQGDNNRTYADVVLNGVLQRVQVGGDRSEGDKRLALLTDVNINNPQANDYLRFNGSEWENDKTLNNKIQRFDNEGYINGSYVRYDASTDIVQKLNQKLTLPSEDGAIGDSLVLGIGNVVSWKKVQVGVIDDLTSESINDALSANQGKVLKTAIDSTNETLKTKITTPSEPGIAGQCLSVDALGNTIWKTVGGGGQGASTWDEVDNKPFDVVDDANLGYDNPDFSIKTETLPSGNIKILNVNDDLFYRPTDTVNIGNDVDPDYLPCSVAENGVQKKKRITWTNFANKIKNAIFNMSASPVIGSVATWDGTKWKDDSGIPDSIEVLSDAVEDLDDALANKADIADSLDGYGIDDAYTKDEVDTIIEGLLPEAVGGEGKVITKMVQEDGELDVTATNLSDLVDDKTIEYDTSTKKLKTKTLQILGEDTGDHQLFTFTNSIFSSSDVWIVDICCNDATKYVIEQNISGDIMTVSLDSPYEDGETPIVVCVANKASY